VFLDEGNHLMKTTADAIVIGAGVIGSSIALELSRNGFDVVVVDKAGGMGHGSTSASSAVVRFNYSSWAGVASSWESLACWENWSEHLDHVDPAGMASYTRTGMLVIDGGPTDSSRTTDMFDKAGIAWERWGPEDVRKHMPYVDTGSYFPPKPVRSEEFFSDSHGEITGIFTPDAGHIDDPQLAAQNLGVAAQSLGARFLFNRTVTSIQQQDDQRWSVATSRGESISARVVVNAAGPWSSAINALAGVGTDFGISSRPMRQEVHQVPLPADFEDDGNGMAIADLDLGTYIRTSSARGLLVGGTEPECDPLEWLDDPDTANLQPTVSGFENQVTRAARRMPGLSIPNRPSGIGGVYDVTDDWTPIYDRTDREGFFVAMGTSGNQFKNAPVAGQLMAQLVTAVQDGHDHDRKPIEFACARTGATFDVGAYSRLRTVDPNSPGSVMG
jgi:sarcosine oxidase subunit beta